MSGTLLVGLFLFYLFAASAKNLQVSVYYEALCPDSIKFVTTQLYPSFKDVGKYLTLDLVPFGKATASNASGHWEFTCQHGSVECFNNKVHSCVLALNSVASSMEFINCAMIVNQHSNDSLKLCAKYANIPWNLIEGCLSSGKADDLLAENGIKTRYVTPPISYIPTIIFNGVYSRPVQKKAEKHFLKVVCELLKGRPDICKKLGIIYNLIM